MPESISSKEAKDSWGDTISRVQYGKERITITKKGKAAVALVSLDDLRLLEEIERLEYEQDEKQALKALAEAEKKGTTSWKDVKKKSGI